jgi:hypothetical protein
MISRRTVSEVELCRIRPLLIVSSAMLILSPNEYGEEFININHAGPLPIE